jgi:hypothetical protein
LVAPPAVEAAAPVSVDRVADDPAPGAPVTVGTGLGVVLAGAAALAAVPAGWVAASAGAGSAGAAAWVTAVTAVVTGLVTVPTTEPTALVTEAPAAEPAGVTFEAEDEPASAEAADVTVKGAGGGAASVAAWACLEKSSRRNKIPAAAIANCATRTAARCASSCGIDSSYPRRTRPRTPGGGEAPDQPCTAVRTRHAVRSPPYITGTSPTIDT